MKKWYYSIHVPTGDVSLFESSVYGGRDGFDSKEEAIKNAIKYLVEMQRLTTKSLLETTKSANYYAKELDNISQALLILGT